MRKAALILTMMMCVLLPGATRSASTRERSDARIVSLPPEQETFCNFPEGRPGTAIAHRPYAAAQPSARNSPAATAASFSGNSFAGFVRCPANDPANLNCTDLLKWKPADDAVGYYRDVIFSAVTTITNAKDGEQWGMTITRPDGGQFSFSPVTFTSTGNCFIFPSQQICGATGIKIYWYFNTQCALTGQWKADAKYGETVFASQPFVIKPQLGSPDEIATRMPPFAQKNYPNDTYAGLCHTPDYKTTFPCSQNKPGQVAWTIQEIGCTLISLTSILNYHGVQTDPVQLDKWLLDNGYYSPLGDILVSDAVTDYARTQNVELTYYGLLPALDTGVYDSMCQLGPMVLRVAGNMHTVTSTGTDDAKSTFTILDANDGVIKGLTTYNNVHNFYIAYGGKMRTFTDRSGAKFTFHSPVEAFVVDPLGRRKGLDPRTGVRYDEIPDAFYGEFSTIGPVRPEGYEPPKLLNLQHPAEGTYTLSVVGTGVGTYDAEFTMFDQDGGSSEQKFSDVATAPGVLHTYQVEFSKAPGAQIVVAGSFDGGGQRPRDVNKFLSYAQPAATSTSLPAGTDSYTLLVFYGQSVIPSTFRAQLNGVDITSLFNPSAGSGQTVTLPLQAGRNVLQLSVDGQLPNRVATDSDRLIFDVQ